MLTKSQIDIEVVMYVKIFVSENSSLPTVQTTSQEKFNDTFRSAIYSSIQSTCGADQIFVNALQSMHNVITSVTFVD